jgi:FAD/FMN-containing dehydrogenase
VARLDRRELLVGAAAGVLAGAPSADAAAAFVERLLGGAALSGPSLSALREAARGPVLLPGTPEYELARPVFNLRYDGVRPAAIVQPVDARDVQAVVQWANRFDEPIVPRSGGHSYAGYSTTDGGVVVDLSRLRGVSVSNGLVRVGAGAQLIDVYAVLAQSGLSIPAGSCPSVGIGGLALGGGHGLSGRRYGLTSDSVRGVTIVTAGGRIRQVDAGSDADLFWACRGGGGGNFGIVTRLTLEAHRTGGAAWFHVGWPWSAADEALAAWQAFAPEAPDELTSIFSLGTSRGSGSPQVAAVGQYFGEQSSLPSLVRPLTRVDGATLSVGSSTTMELALRWAGCLEQGLRACHTERTRPGGQLSRAAFYAKSDYVDRALTADGRRTMIDGIERRQLTPSLGSGMLLLDAYGGAYNRPAPDATAFVHRHMLFSIQYLAYFPSGGGPASREWIEGVWSALRPHVSGQAYQNYIDPRLAGWQRAYYHSNLARLREVKKQVDPDFRFRFRQAIPPA